MHIAARFLLPILSMTYSVDSPTPPPIVRVSDRPEEVQFAPEVPSVETRMRAQLPLGDRSISAVSILDRNGIVPTPGMPESFAIAQFSEPSNQPSELSDSVLGEPLNRQYERDWYGQPSVSIGTTALDDLAPAAIAPRSAPTLPFTNETSFEPLRWSPFEPDAMQILPAPMPSEPIEAIATPNYTLSVTQTALPELRHLERVGTGSATESVEIPPEWVASVELPADLFDQLAQQLDEQRAGAIAQSDAPQTPADEASPPETNGNENSDDIEFVRPEPIFAPFPDATPLEPGLSIPPQDSDDIQNGETQDTIQNDSPDAIPGAIPDAIPDAMESDRPTLVIPDPNQPTPAADLDPTTPPEVPPPDIVELTADTQEFDDTQQVFVAEGNVEMRYQGSILRADRLRVNLVNRYAVAEGNVSYLEPGQRLQGDRMEYNFVRREGTVFNARGETVPEDQELTIIAESEDGDASEPLEVESAGSLSIGVGVGRVSGRSGGGVQRIRFEADRIDFIPGGWTAENARFTNDPFSPPELEIRANTVTFTRLSATRSEIRARNPRMVFDRGLSIPLLRSRFVIDQDQNQAFPLQVGFDERDRDGFYIERTFRLLETPDITLTLTPQFYVQRGIDEGFNPLDPLLYGAIARLGMRLSPTTTLGATAEFTSFDFSEEDYDERIRANLRLNQRINRHTLTFESVYRDRVFNGSLGFRNVRWSYGLILTSPRYVLGDTGIVLTYEAGLQRINANIASDRRADLLPPRAERENNRATLTRFQIGAALSRTIRLWTGEPLPATAEEGLRYTPVPLVPSVDLVLQLEAFSSFYSSGDTQPGITPSISIRGQFGHLSDDAFDYLDFNLSYSITPEGPKSPFVFDRLRDRQVLSGGVTVQLFGPLLFGVQTSYNLTEREEISTVYLLQYQRRTYSLTLRYNPRREIGSFGIQINDFNWTGDPQPFSGSGETRFPED
jgi:hypothetical protein